MVLIDNQFNNDRFSKKPVIVCYICHKTCHTINPI